MYTEAFSHNLQKGKRQIKKVSFKEHIQNNLNDQSLSN